MHSHLLGHPSLAQAVRRLERLNPEKFELYFSRRRATQIDSKDQKVDSLTQSEDVGLAVRILKDKRLGFSFTTSLDEAAILRAVDSANEVAKYMPEDPYADLFSFGSAVYPNLDSLDSKGLQVPIEQKIDLARRLEAECRKSDSRIQGVRAATFREVTYEIHMVDSNSEHVQHQGSLFTASISCRAEQDGDNQMGGDFGFSNFLDGLDVKDVARSAAHYATELLGAGTAPTMKCPAVIRNEVVAELVEFLAGSFSAEEIQKGRSMLAGKEGTRVFSEQVTLINDGLMPGGYASSPFDGEGVPSKTTTLVDGGFFSEALYDQYHARKLGKEPTGSAVRGIKAPPSIGVSNLYLKKGRKTPTALMAGIKKGVLITNLMGVHTANPVTGDFSLGASGLLIENGKITKPVRGFAVAGNVLELFRRMTDIGNDMKQSGSIGAPSVRVSEISVGGT